MKRLVILAAFTLTLMSTFAQTMEKTPVGVRMKLPIMDIEFRFFGPDMVRVLKTPPSIISTRKSLVITKTPQATDLKTDASGDTYTVNTKDMRIDVTISTGRIRFSDANGLPLLFEMEETTVVAPNGFFVGDTTFSVQQSFKFDDNERIYGLGQLQNGKLNQRKTTIRLRQENAKISIPYFQSSKGYALYWDNYSPTLFGDNSFDTHFKSEMGQCVDYCFIVGKPGDELTAKMRDLSGQSPMLPLWAFGFFQSKEHYKNQQEPVDVVTQYRNLSIPLDGIVQDRQYWGSDKQWNAMKFDPITYSNPRQMIDQIHALNARIMISLWPSFGEEAPQYMEFHKRRSLLDFETWPKKTGTRVYDPFNPEARKLYWSFVKKGLFDLGIDSWWLDGIEPMSFNLLNEQFDQRTYLGAYRLNCNAYPLMANTAVYENQRITTSSKRVVIFSRSAFAGQQRLGTICSSGEVTSSWENLEKQIPAALSLSTTGIPYWSSDIGGFTSAKSFPNGIQDKSFHELYVRWMQFATFTPMMRSHGADTPREIYQFGKPGDWSFDAQAKSIRLRYRLLPYLYSTAWQVSSKGKTFMRPLFYDYPNDPKANNLLDEYLFGQSFLVAPVIKSQYVSKVNGNSVEQFGQSKNRSIYLPEGNWFDFWTGETIKGGQTITKNTPIDIIPLYVPSGSIVPWGPEVNYSTEKNWKELEIRVYAGTDGTFTLYEDETDNYNYEKGAFTTIPFTWNESKRTLTIGQRNGSFKGMIKKRVFKVVVITPDSNPGDQSAVKINRKVTYKGKAVTVKL